MLRTQVYLNNQSYKLAKELAEDMGVNVSVLVREGLDMVVSKYKVKPEKDPLQKLEGKYSGAPKDMALDHNSIYE